MAGTSRRAAGGAGRVRSVGDVLRRWSRPLHVERLEDRLAPSFTQTGIPNWLETGPFQASNGQATGITGTSANPVSGAVEEITPDPNDANILFAAGVNGGVWKTTNALAANPTWTPLTDQLPSLSIGDMDLDPADPNRVIAGVGRFSAYAQLGEDLTGVLYTSNGLAASPQFNVLGYGSLDGLAVQTVLARTGTNAAGAAVPYLFAGGSRVTNAAGSTTLPTANQTGYAYRSLDGGQTWTPLNGVGGLPLNGNLYESVADPADPNRVYAVGASGIYRTDDITAAAPVWTNVTTPGLGFATASIDNAKIAIHNSAAGNIVYLAVTSGDLVSISWSANRGGSWTQMDRPQSLTDALQIADASYSSGSVITITTNGGTGLSTGDRVYIQGVNGELGANGVWTVTVTGINTFTLDGSVATGIYTGGGTYARIFFTHPGQQSQIHLSLAADPTNPNLVYIGGDRQDFLNFPNPNQTGAVDFTSNLFRGDRTQTPGFGAYLQSPQWTVITGDGAANNSSPHADSRGMAFDAQGNLIEGDDGGIYKRFSPQTGTGSWVSLLGNMDLGQFVGVSYDSVNNVTFGGTQDTGAVQQAATTSAAGTPAGSTSWTTAPEPNAVTGRLVGDGGDSAVDNTSSPGQSIRYEMGNNFARLVRNTYNSSGGLVSSNYVLFQAPDKIGTPYSGFNQVDGVGASFTSQFVLNTVDPRLGMVGITHLYEDNDPSPALGGTFDVIADVTPAGMTGDVTSIVYGGKQALATGPEAVLPRVAYVGTSTGQMWERVGTDGFTQVTSLPASASGLVIRSIVVDPDNYRTVYVLAATSALYTGNGVGQSHVYMSTDAGATFTDITANLHATKLNPDGTPADGLSTEIATLAIYDPNPGSLTGGTVLFAGGRGGVYKLASTDTTGQWVKFGAGLPSAYVYDLEVNGSRLTAGTQGRGAWVVPDVSGSVGPATVVVNAAAGGSNMSLQVNPSNPNFIIVNDGQGNVLQLQAKQIQGISFVGGAGVDTVTIVGSGVAGGTLVNVGVPITVDLGGTAGDALIVRNTVTTTAVAATITATTIGETAGDNLFGTGGGITYAGLGAGTVQLELGATAPDGNVVSIRSTSALTTRVVGGAGADTVKVGSLEGGDDAGNLDGVAGAVDFDGGGGANTLVLSDFSTATANASVYVGPGLVAGLAGPTDSTPVTYENLSSLVIMGSDNAATPEAYAVLSPTAALTLFAEDGPDLVTVGSNTLPVLVDGGGGDNQLVVDQSQAQIGLIATVTSNAIVGATGAVVGYQDTGGRFYAANGGGVRLIGSQTANNLFTVASTLAGSQTVVDGGAGTDTFVVAASGLGGTVLLRGGAGADTFSVTGGANGNTGDSLTTDGGGGGDAVSLTGTDGDETAAMSFTGPGSASVTGVGNRINLANIATLSYDGGGGRNLLSVTDATAGGLGSVSNPTGGFVYKPTGGGSGQLWLAGGTVGPALTFSGLNGKDANGFVVSGGAGGDTLLALGASDTGLGTGGTFGELTVPDGSDTITVSDAVVTFFNKSVGYLQAVAVGTGATGRPALTTLIVRGGNEGGTRGDTFTVTPSSQLNIVVDGGAPARSPGDTLSVATTQAVSLTRTNGQTRAVTASGASVGFSGFENISTGSGNAVGGAGRTGQIVAVGADEGGGPRVTVYDAGTQAVLFDQFAYEPTFTGGVRVATGDVNGDGIPDIIVAAGYGGGPRIRVFDGVTFGLIADFFAYEPTFTGGLYVAVGDLDGSGKGEIVVGAGLGGGPLVRVFDGTGKLLTGFFAYDPNFRGGVRVATGDTNGDGNDDIITGAGPGGGPHVQVFNASNLSVLDSFQAFDPATETNGVYVAAADLNGDGGAEVIVGPGGTQISTVVVRTSGTHQLQAVDASAGGTLANAAQAGSPDSLRETGIRVAKSTYGAVAGRQSFVTARGPGYASQVSFYAGLPATFAGSLQAFEPGFTGGIFVG